MVLQVYYLKNKLLSMTFENDLSEFAKNISRGALSNILWVVVLDCDFFVQDIAFVPSYSHVS